MCARVKPRTCVWFVRLPGTSKSKRKEAHKRGACGPQVRERERERGRERGGIKCVLKSVCARRAALVFFFGGDDEECNAENNGTK